MRRLFAISTLIIMALLTLGIFPVTPAVAAPARQDDQVAQGKYIAAIAGCVGCHTPIDKTTFTPVTGKEFSGGEPFDLGPLGIVYSKNLTSDMKTGLGDWTDEEIKTAITTGVSKDGLHLFPVMPYHFFNNMADKDLDTLVAFLRTIPPIENQVERRQILPPEALPQLERKSGIVAPDPKDTAARGRYLMTSVLVCNDCHTPVNPETQQPILEKYLAGGQPFEGPWGIVYGGNITPDQKTGIGSWTDADIERLLRTGVRPDGRVTVVMPFFIYQNLNADDMKAVTYYLKNDVKAVDGVVPAANLKEGFERYVEIALPQPAVDPLLLGVVGGVLFLLVGGGVFLFMRNRASATK